MPRHERAQRPAHSEGEYVTNWGAIIGVASIGLLLLLVMAGGLFFTSSPPRATDGRQPAEVASANRDSRTARHSARDVQFRIALEDDPAPAPAAELLVVRHPARATAQLTATAFSDMIAGELNNRADLVFDALTQIELRSQWTNQLAAPKVDVSSEFRFAQPLPHTTGKVLSDYLVSRVPEIDIQATTKSFVDAAKDADKSQGHGTHAALLVAMSQERSDLRGLPLSMGEDCTSEREVAVERQKLAFAVRVANRRQSLGYLKTQKDFRRDYPYNYKVESENDYRAGVFARYKQLVESESKWRDASQVAILEQMLQIESPVHRELCLEMLAEIEGKEAGQAIARRAIFDLDASVREVAVDKLTKRSAGEFNSVLEKGRRYPWTPVANRSEQLLRQLNGASAGASKKQAAPSPGDAGEDDRNDPEVDEIVNLLLHGSHKSAPYQAADQQWVVDELVKVNHLRNCALCHPVSTDTEHPLRGQIPSPGERLPQIYYSSNRGNFVRADVVYLRQDFSVMLPVENPGKWPEVQRYDFFVRTRPASPGEVSSPYPQPKHDDPATRHLAAHKLRRFFTTLPSEVCDTVAMLLADEAPLDRIGPP